MNAPPKGTEVISSLAGKIAPEALPAKELIRTDHEPMSLTEA